MATKPLTIVKLTDKVVIAKWTGMANGDDGAPLEYPDYADRTVQVFGTFGAAGSLRIEGTNEDAAAPANYATLTSPAGANLDITTAGIKGVVELAGKVRPRVTAGDGNTSLNVYLIARRP